MTALSVPIPPAQLPTAYHRSRVWGPPSRAWRGINTFNQPGHQVRPTLTKGDDAMGSVRRMLQRLERSHERVARIELIGSSTTHGAFLFNQAGLLVAHVERATMHGDHTDVRLLVRLLRKLGIGEKLLSDVLSDLERSNVYALVLSRETRSELDDYDGEVVTHTEPLRSYWSWWQDRLM